MKPTDPTPTSPLPQERLHFVKHKGHVIYVIDFSNCEAKEILLLLDQVRADVARHPHGSLLTLADFSARTSTRRWRGGRRKCWCWIVLM